MILYVAFPFVRSFVMGGNEWKQYITELMLSSIMFTKDFSIKETLKKAQGSCTFLYHPSPLYSNNSPLLRTEHRADLSMNLKEILC